MEKVPQSIDVRIKGRFLLLVVVYEEEENIVSIHLGMAVKLFRKMNSAIKEMMEDY
jgi:hypothetical protein